MQSPVNEHTPRKASAERVEIGSDFGRAWNLVRVRFDTADLLSGWSPLHVPRFVVFARLEYIGNVPPEV